MFIGRTDVEAEMPILWPTDTKNWLIGKDPDAGKDWGQEKGMTGWDGWMDPTRWTWVWVDSGSWWWTGRPGILQFMESQRFGHDWATELNWNLYSGHEATVRTLYGTNDWFRIWERNMTRLFIVTLFNFYAEHTMQNTSLDELQAGTKIVGRNKQPQIWGWYHSNGRSKEELKILLMRVKEQWKSQLKSQYKKN